MVAHLTIENEISALHSQHRKSSARLVLLSSLARMLVTQKIAYWGNVYNELSPATQWLGIPFYPLEETSF